MQVEFNSTPTVEYKILIYWGLTAEKKSRGFWSFFFLRGKDAGKRIHSVVKVLCMRGL